jgi:hypothetical protein
MLGRFRGAGVLDLWRLTTTVRWSCRSPEPIAFPSEFGESTSADEPEQLSRCGQRAIRELNARQIATQRDRDAFSRDIVRNSDSPISFDDQLVVVHRRPDIGSPGGTRYLDEQRPTVGSRLAEIRVSTHGTPLHRRPKLRSRHSCREG